MPLKVTFDYYSKKDSGYDFSQKKTSTEIFAENIVIPSKDECCALLGKLMSRRDILVERIASAEILFAELSVSVSDGEIFVGGYPEGSVPEKITVAPIAVAVDDQPSLRPETTSPVSGAQQQQGRSKLNDEISALMRGASFSLSKTIRRVYYDPSDVHLIQLTRKNNLIVRDGIRHDNERSLVIATKVYDVVAEADNPRGTGRIVIVRNEKGKLIHFPEHFAVDKVNGEMTTSIGPDNNGPRLDFGRVVPTGPGEDVDSGAGDGTPLQIADPSQLMQQFGIKPNRNIPV